jgi:beta-glucanase (GH16 family)
MESRHSRMTVVLALLALSLTGFARCGGGWKQVWQDEFEGAAGQVPKPGTWSYDVGTGPSGDGWGNGQLEYDTARPDNVSLDGAGHLAITARREAWQGSSYTSARILTKGRVAQTRGRIEASIQLPVGKGIWPAFWLLGADIDTVGWPACGEIDVMEAKGQDPLTVYGTLHGPGYSGGNAIGRSYTLQGEAGFDQAFHLFAVEWDEDQIVWEVDGDIYHAVRRSELPAGAAWVFDRPFFVLLNLAVGGPNWGGAPDGTTQFPQTMLVDYVRIFERDQ